MCNFYENYQMLAEAIVIQAIKDYRKCRCHQTKDYIENFFGSQWFTTLCGLDGEKVIRKLRKEGMRKHG